MKTIKACLLIGILFLTLFFGSITIQTSKEALFLWFEKLVPSLFVTLVLIRTIHHLHLLDKFSIPFLNKYLCIDDSTLSLILCTMLLGFPSNAQFIDEAVVEKRIQNAQAKRLLYTCSFAAPGFVIVTCGSLLFHSMKIGMLLFLSQILSGVFLLRITRSQKIEMKPLQFNQEYSLMNALSRAIKESGSVLYMIGGYLLLFMSVTGVLLSFVPDFIAYPIRIVAEFSSGTLLLQKLTFSSFLVQILTCGLLSFGGFCVHMQVHSMSEHIQYSYPVYFCFRLLQAILSIFCFVLLQIFC